MTDATDTIIGIAARGEGQSALGSFVPMTAPGDWLDAGGAWQAGPHRQAAACPHFPTCGGCQLQHVDDSAYAAYVAGRVAGALAGQDLPPTDVHAPYLSPPATRRRAAMKAQRIGNSVLLGFNAQRSAQIVDVRDCAVLHPDLMRLVAPLRTLMGALLPKKGVGAVTLTLCDQGVDVLLGGVRIGGLDAHMALADFGGDHRLARLAIDQGDGPETQWEPEPVTVTFGSIPVGLPHAAFLQATQDGEAALVAGVLAAVGDAAVVADLFAGLGTFTFNLAGARKVTAIEGARDAITALRLAANRSGRQIDPQHRDLYRRPMTAKELVGTDAVILDPPRAGAAEQVVELAASAVPRIAYVSCNPASFARDARLLAGGGYAIDWIRPVGQFRWSTHIELVACLSMR